MTDESTRWAERVRLVEARMEAIRRIVETGEVPKTIAQWQEECHALSVAKGWYPEPLSRGDTHGILAKLALIHSEVSEAVEATRDGEIELHYVTDRFGQQKPEGLVVEIADVVIRCFDLCGALGLDLEQAIATKVKFNRSRSHRHGGRLA